MAAFTDAAQAYIAAGIIPLPMDPNGKKPLVRQPEAFGHRAAVSILPKFPDANLGFMGGRRNRVTVVDIDSPADAELQYALDTFGPSPIIVRTASGNHHAYYRHDGERRSIRPIAGHAIDILGEGGPCVAPPSVGPSGGRYEFVRGGLPDLANLPKMRGDVLKKLEPAPVEGSAPSTDPATVGQRNDRLFKLAIALAYEATTQAVLLTQLREANATLCNPPLSDAEVQGRALSAWRYKMADRLMVSGMASSTVLPSASIGRLLAAGETDAMALLALLRKHHSGRRNSFAASPEAMAHARLIGSWSKRRYREATRKLCDVGELVQVAQGGKGKHTPSLYRFGVRGLI